MDYSEDSSFDESSDYSSSSEPERKKKKRKTKKKLSKSVEYSSSNDDSETESDKPKRKKPKLKKKFIERKKKAKKRKSPSPPPPYEPSPSPPAKRTPPIMVNPPGTSQLLSSNQTPAAVKVPDIQLIPTVSGGGRVSCPSEQWIMLMDYVQ